MRKLVVAILALGIGTGSFAQKYLTQTGVIRFFSETPMENIEALNNQVSGVINTETGDMAFTLLMKAFSFEKALMQEHFNEKYVESDKFPKASFKGQIVNFSSLQLGVKPVEVTIKGKLTIHGVTQDIEVKGSLAKPSDNKMVGTSTFSVKLADYDIEVPSAVVDNISETIEIKVKMDYEKMD